MKQPIVLSCASTRRVGARLLPITLLVWIMSPAVYGVDVSHPVQARQPPSIQLDHSPASTAQTNALEVEVAARQAQEVAEGLQEQDSTSDYAWYVYTADGLKIPYELYVKDHLEFIAQGLGYVGSNGDRIGTASTPNPLPKVVAPVSQPVQAVERGNPMVLRLLLILLVIAILSAIVYLLSLIKAEKRARHTASPDPSNAGHDADIRGAHASNTPVEAHPPSPVTDRTRPIPHPAGQTGAITLPSASPTVPSIAAKADSEPTADSADAAEKPIEFIRPVMTAVQGNRGSGFKSAVRYGIGHAQSMTPGKVSLYVEQHLDAFAQGLLLEPMVYRAQLQKADLDYSAASLTRIDQFLIHLREETTPEITDYTNRDDYRTLLVFLGFYVATTIARITHQTISWYDYASLRIRLQNPTLMASLHNSYSCILGRNNHFMPIELITSILFAANNTRTCSGQLTHAQQHAQSYAPIPRSSQHTVISADTDQERAWVDAIKLAGHLAAKSVYQLQHGSLVPLLMYPKNRVQLVGESLSGDDPTEFFNRMTHNPQQLAYQALAYDSSANLPTGICPALTITARCYGSHVGEWTIMLPYRPANDPEGFAIFTPLLAPSDIPAYYNTLLMHAFYSGVVMISLPGNPWFSHLQET